MKAFFVVVAVLLVLGVLFGSGDDDDSGGGDAPDRSETIGDAIGAQVVCQQFVEDRLKSPSTADFSDETATHIDGKRWQVVGSVDSENSFGAMIRNDYRCLVTFAGDDNWRLVELNGLGN